MRSLLLSLALMVGTVDGGIIPPQPPTTEWSGECAQFAWKETDPEAVPSLDCKKEMGFRSDGVVVWRNHAEKE